VRKFGPGLDQLSKWGFLSESCIISESEKNSLCISVENQGRGVQHGDIWEVQEAGQLWFLVSRTANNLLVLLRHLAK
jgi:hypothetical protein